MIGERNDALDFIGHNSSNQKPSIDLIESLSNELMTLIFSCLTVEDLSRSISLVNKKWYRIASCPTLWKTFIRTLIPSLQVKDNENWKMAWLQRKQWEKKICRQLQNPQEFYAINNYSSAEGLLILDVNIVHHLGGKQNKIEVWDQKINQMLHSFDVSNKSARLVVNQETLAYSYNEKVKNKCWRVNIRVLDAKRDFPVHCYVSLGCQPSLVFLDLDEDRIIAKINHLFLYVSDLAKKNVRIMPLVSTDPKYKNVIYRNGDELWLGDDNKLKIYDISTLTLKRAIDIPDFGEFNADIALIPQKILSLSRLAIKGYKIYEKTIKEIWSKETENGLQKKIVVSQDKSPYFGLHSLTLKTLEIYDSTDGQALCRFDEFQANKILLDKHSIRYLNESNQLITLSFDPQLANI